MGGLTQKFGGILASDPTPGEMFFSPFFIPRLFDRANYNELRDNPATIAVEGSLVVERQPAYERELSRVAQSFYHRAGRLFQTQRLITRPYKSEAYKGAFLLPLPDDGNQTGKCWLTYQDPEWKSFIRDLSFEILREYPDDDEVAKAVGVWHTDYSLPLPFSIQPKTSPRFQMRTDPQFDAQFRRKLAECMDEAVTDFVERPAAYLPAINRTKGLGMDTILPSGEPYDPAAWVDVRPEWADKLPDVFSKSVSRKDYSAVRTEWVKSGALLRNFQHILDVGGKKEPLDPAALLEALTFRSILHGTWGSRDNDSDGLVFDVHSFLTSREMSRASPQQKDRAFDIVRPDYSVLSGTLSAVKVGSWYQREVRPDRWQPGVSILRRRTITNVSNASIGCVFQVIAKIISDVFEKRAHGFPTINSNGKRAYEAWFQKYGGPGAICLFADTTNSENTINDNLDWLISLFPNTFQKVLNAAAHKVISSELGARYVRGFVSGEGFTTAYNMVKNVYVQAFLLTSINSWLGGSSSDNMKVLDQYFDFRFDKRETVCLRNDLRVYPFLPTDDMTIVFSERLPSALQAKVERLLETLNCKFKWAKTGTTFGVRVGGDELVADLRSGLSKLFLQEKEKNGDIVAAKFSARAELLPEYMPIVQRVMSRHGFGLLSSYKKARPRFAQILRDLGYSPDFSMLGAPLPWSDRSRSDDPEVEALLFEVFNEYSPSGRLAVGEFLAKYGMQDSSVKLVYDMDSFGPIMDCIKQQLSA